MGVPEKTLITGEEILEYIPQRPPVVMVDTFYGIDERGCARSGLTVTADNLLVADGVLDECGIVEHIAQPAALRAGYMNRTMGRRVQLGYIGAVNDLKVHFLPPVGSRLFVSSRVPGVPLGQMTRPLLPLFAMQILGLFAVTYFPALSLWLPGMVLGKVG